jgi:hypothetical protein
MLMTQGYVPNDGNFRNPQSFTLLDSAHLLEKLRWELNDLRQAQWLESLDNWRQVVSYKAVNFATTAWHLVEWVDEETRRAIIPRAALASLFGINLASDPPTPATSKKEAQDEFTRLRDGILTRCRELKVCRVIAIASKHYEVRRDPNPAIRTEAYLSTKKRDAEDFQQPIMYLRVHRDGVTQSAIEAFETVLRFLCWRCTRRPQL